MKALRELRAHELDADALRQVMNETGYLLIRDAIRIPDVEQVLEDMTSVLADAGWLQSDSNPVERLPIVGAAYGDPDPAFKSVYQKVFNLESVHALPHTQPLRSIMQMLVGEDVLVHPKPIARLIFPNSDRLVVRPHQDYEFMKGDPAFYTAWIPLHDCAIHEGSLRILEGSHRLGILEHERQGLHVPELSVSSFDESSWASGTIRAGDALIFHSFTVHAANPNVARAMRLSIDYRFQSAGSQINPSNLVFAGESGKSWEKTYAGWNSHAFQYYWKNLPLVLNPTREELVALAASADDEKMRERYTRMAAQL